MSARIGPRHGIHEHRARGAVRFVLPNATRDVAPPAVAHRLDEVRDLVLAGEGEAAQRAFTDGRRPAWTQPFHPGFVVVGR